MNILAFDTCYDACSAAVLHDGRVATRFEPMRTGQAERLMPMIAEVLAEADLAPADLDRIAVTRGPGTFTGTRIGLAAARALVLATGATGFGFSSLFPIARADASAIEAVGNHAPVDLLIVARPSRRDTHDCQIFSAEAKPMSRPFAGSASEITDAIKRISGPNTVKARLLGSGACELQEAMASADFLDHEYPRQSEDARFSEPNALHLLDLASASDLDPAVHPLTPLYLRPADAKPSGTPPVARAEPSR